jgi:hypothetical protein
MLALLTVTTGRGFTVIRNVLTGPGHPFKVVDTLMVAVIGFTVAFVAVKAGIFPVPDKPRPIAALLLVHETEAPAGVVVKFKGPTV